MLKHILRNYISGIIFGFIILILSILPVGTEGKSVFFVFPGADKVIHAIMYGVFSGLLTNGFLRSQGFKWKKLLLLLAAILTYSVLIEIIQQYLTSYRNGEFLDVLANMAGILVGAALVYTYRKIKY